MKRIAIIEKETGVIDFAGDLPDGNVATPKEDKFVLFDIDPSIRTETHYYLNGEFYQHTEEEIKQRASVPLGFKWKMPERTIVDCRTLDFAKKQKWEEIKKIRTQLENSTFFFNEKEFQADKIRITSASQTAMLAKNINQPFSIDWILVDNSTVTLDADQMIALGAALGDFVSNLFKISQQLRGQINACLSNQDVDAVSWPSV